MKTAKQEELEGNPGHRPVNKEAPEININIPNPPKFLDAIGKRAYHELVRIVGPEGMQVMSKSDSLSLTMICDAYAEYREAKKTIENDGRYYKTPNGTKRHPAIGDMQDAWKRIMTGLSKFGMTPYDRKNVNVLKSITTKETREEKKARTRAEASLRAKELAKKQNHITKVG